MMISNKIGSVAEYLASVNELDKSYLASPTANKFIYRGMSNIEYQLLPSIFRKSKDNDISINCIVENKCYTEHATEKQVLQAFISEACTYIKKDTSKHPHIWAEYAQHYGVPTRFLDWTENPLVALYFACKENKPDYPQPTDITRNEEYCDIGGKDGVVWMLHVDHYRKFANQVGSILYSSDQKEKLSIGASIDKAYAGTEAFVYPIIYKPYYTDLRMSAQSSMFMVWGKNKEPLEHFFNEGNRLCSNEQSDGSRCRSKNEDEIVMKYEIYRDRKQPILRELERCGVSEKSLFPGLDGIGRYIVMKYHFDLEEEKERLL